ncbi:MAG: hypothetical protein LBS88_12865 [Tannerellaceae bacterium]|jgi:hypothetical protein|nr:hypothetical protein [Tannerellaceae bacterium]
MGKYNSNKHDKQKNRAQAPPQAEQTNRGGGYLTWVVKNVGVALVVGFLLSRCLEVQQGYNWAYNSLLKGNMATIRANPNLTVAQKNEMKLGIDYAYLQFVRNATPEDAVILYPSVDDFFPEGVESPFKHGISNKMWGLRFLYPRKLVLPSEMETNRYAGDITHVAIVNGRGYERLNYEVDASVVHGVLPVKH